MSDIRHGAPVTLAQIHQELKDMGFGDDDQDINGGDFVEYGGQLFEDLTKAMAYTDPSARMSRALRSVMECLGNWMEIADTDDKRQYDQDALGNWMEIADTDDKRQYDQDAMDEAQLALDAYNAGAGDPVPPTMAERWVKLYNEWYDSTHTHVMDFGDWLDKYHEGERETLTWIASWDARPVDACLKADPRRATAFGVMDFGDGSIAIKRNFNSSGFDGHAPWMVAS